MVKDAKPLERNDNGILEVDEHPNKKVNDILELTARVNPVRLLGGLQKSKITKSLLHHQSGWVLVRNMTEVSAFHPASDHLAGTNVYGVKNSTENAWSINFEEACPGYD